MVVPWMLLTPPREQVRAGVAGAPTRAEPLRARGRGTAWIVLGDLDAALFQAGFIDVAIERMRRPRVIFAGGVAALNGVLALDGRGLAFRIGWERARASHLLEAAALDRSPLPRLRPNGRSPRAYSILASVERPGAGTSSPDGTRLRLLTAGGYVDLDAGSPVATTALVSESLSQHPGAAAMAAAIDACVALDFDRVIAFGVDERLIGAREVARAIEDAHGSGMEVSTLAMSAGERPGLLGYLLPGLGRADRLMESGRAAARKWLSQSDAAAVTA
jgi:hypothetical protein